MPNFPPRRADPPTPKSSPPLLFSALIVTGAGRGQDGVGRKLRMGTRARPNQDVVADVRIAKDAEGRPSSVPVPVPESSGAHQQNPHTEDHGSPHQSNYSSPSPASAPSATSMTAQVDYRAMEQKVQDREQKVVAIRDHLEQEKHRRHEMEQKYNDLLLKIKKLEALSAQQALPDSSSAQVDYRAMEQKFQDREQEVVAIRNNLEQEKHRRQEMEQKYNDLLLQIKKLEALLSQQDLPDSRSAQVDYRAMDQKVSHREPEIVAIDDPLEQDKHRRQEMDQKYNDLLLKALLAQLALPVSGSAQVDYRAMGQKVLHCEQEIVALRNHLEQDNHRRQEMEQKYNDLLLKALLAQLALPVSGSAQVDHRAMEQKVLHCEQEIVALCNHLEQENHRRQKMEQKYNDLRFQIEKLKALHSQQALPLVQADYHAMEQKVQHCKQENVVLRDHLEREKQSRLEMEQKCNGLDIQIKELKALHAQQALPDSGSVQVDCRAMEQKVPHREQEIAAQCNDLEQEKHRRQELEQKYNKLEALFAKQAQPDGGSYGEFEPTPPSLQNAADGVKDAIVACARKFFSEIKERQSIINIYALRMNIPLPLLQQKSSEVKKTGLQGVLCRVLFQGFEDPYFRLTENYNSPFQAPSDRKTLLFQDYRKCRDCTEATNLLHEDNDFRGFFQTKVALMNEEVETWRLSSSDVQRICNGILNPKNDKSTHEFLRAAKAVWVLHKLAMAFTQSAEIFRVGRGSFLSGTYMEDVAMHEEDEEGKEDTPPQKQVLFMCVPGFIVRHTVIKSRVFCLLNTKLGSRDTTKDAQSESG